VLLVDEVLSVGDVYFQEKCLDKMREFKTQGVTIVVVSHSAELVEQFCDRAVWLDHGHVVGEGPARELVKSYVDSIHLAHPV
jgi:ABC-type polysaccharide/polyol phosphate transport system ATPase subunit